MKREKIRLQQEPRRWWCKIYLLPGPVTFGPYMHENVRMCEFVCVLAIKFLIQKEFAASSKRRNHKAGTTSTKQTGTCINIPRNSVIRITDRVSFGAKHNLHSKTSMAGSSFLTKSSAKMKMLPGYIPAFFIEFIILLIA